MKSLLQHLPTVANQHRHIVITGEKGVGKHSLLKEILHWPTFAERTVVYSIPEVKEAISSPQVFVLDTTQPVNYSSLSEFTFYADRGDIRVLLLIEGTIDTFLARNPEIQSWYYSLGAYVALLPPLSVRKEDRSQYVHQWVEKLADFLGIKVRLTKEFESYLQSHDLKENYITLNTLLLQSLSTYKNGQLSQPKSVENQVETSRFQVRPFNDMVSDYLKEVLTHTNGKIYGQSGAAYLLKLKPTTLQSKLKKLGLR
jgi:transcriptional regulator with GAF, ATPase, and Fis domain